MRRICYGILFVLLAVLTVSGQQGAAGTITVKIAGATNNPLCTATVTADCIASVDIYSVGFAALIANVPASSFATANDEHTASIPVPTVPGRRYGTIQLFAKVHAIGFDGVERVDSIDGATVTMIRRPPPASLAVN